MGFRLLMVVLLCVTAVCCKEAVVFDIDGTLTPDIVLPFNVRAGAVDAVKAWHDKGYKVVFLTARPDFVRLLTQLWRLKWRFPKDIPIFMAQELLLEDDETIAYKADTLSTIEATEGLSFRYAYGDSTTDFEAYEVAGIDSKKVFALKRSLTESDCLTGKYNSCLEDYVEHLEFIRDQKEAPK